MNREKTRDQEELPMLLYGLQRSSTNYIQKLVTSNFEDIRFCNETKYRFLPTHKHFRLYDDKFMIPEKSFYNSYHYKDFEEFRTHVERIAGREIRKILLVIKNPYSWYISFTKHARKNGYELHKKDFNPHFVWDYHHFYLKWLRFRDEAPGDIELIRYEDVLGDVPGFLSKIGDSIGRKPQRESIHNPTSVYMSKRFSAKRRNFYSEHKYLDQTPEDRKMAIREILDKRILELYDLS